MKIAFITINRFKSKESNGELYVAILLKHMHISVFFSILNSINSNIGPANGQMTSRISIFGCIYYLGGKLFALHINAFSSASKML